MCICSYLSVFYSSRKFSPFLHWPIPKSCHWPHKNLQVPQVAYRWSTSLMKTEHTQLRPLFVSRYQASRSCGSSKSSFLILRIWTTVFLCVAVKAAVNYFLFHHISGYRQIRQFHLQPARAYRPRSFKSCICTCWHQTEADIPVAGCHVRQQIRPVWFPRSGFKHVRTLIRPVLVQTLAVLSVQLTRNRNRSMGFLTLLDMCSGERVSNLSRASSFPNWGWWWWWWSCLWCETTYLNCRHQRAYFFIPHVIHEHGFVSW